MKKLWEMIMYVLSGQATEDSMNAFIESRNPQTPEQRLEVIKEYWRLRGRGW